MWYIVYGLVYKIIWLLVHDIQKYTWSDLMSNATPGLRPRLLGCCLGGHRSLKPGIGQGPALRGSGIEASGQGGHEDEDEEHKPLGSHGLCTNLEGEVVAILEARVLTEANTSLASRQILDIWFSVHVVAQLIICHHLRS